MSDSLPPPPQAPLAPPPVRVPMSEPEARNWAMAAHLCAFAGYIAPFGNIIGPVLIWQIKKEESEFVAFHAKESLNFQISIFIYAIICVVAMFVLIGFLMVMALIVFELVVVIMACMAASRGERYYYPLCIRLVT